jgi:hypothetical protein
MSQSKDVSLIIDNMYNIYLKTTYLEILMHLEFAGYDEKKQKFNNIKEHFITNQNDLIYSCIIEALVVKNGQLAFGVSMFRFGTFIKFESLLLSEIVKIKKWNIHKNQIIDEKENHLDKSYINTTNYIQSPQSDHKSFDKLILDDITNNAVCLIYPLKYIIDNQQKCQISKICINSAFYDEFYFRPTYTRCVLINGVFHIENNNIILYEMYFQGFGEILFRKNNIRTTNF